MNSLMGNDKISSKSLLMFSVASCCILYNSIKLTLTYLVTMTTMVHSEERLSLIDAVHMILSDTITKTVPLQQVNSKLF